MPQARAVRREPSLKSLQVGRGLACLAVVAFHMAVALRGYTSTLGALSHHGNAGVDFFFVLSGFIILFAHEEDVNHPEKLKVYVWRRFIRVYPIYWIYLVPLLVIGLAGDKAILLPKDLASWVSAFTLVRFTDTPMPLLVAWTLFYEIAFYALFATLLLNRTLGMGVFIVWLGVLLLFSHPTDINDHAGVWLSPLCLNFMLGMLACKIHSRLGVRSGAVLALVGLGGLLYAGAFVDRGLGASFGSVLSLSFAALIGGVAGVEARQPMRFGPFVALGDASYTKYLAHNHIIGPLMKGVVRLNLLSRVSPDIIFVVVFCATVAIAFGLFLLIERPLTRWLKPARLPKTPPATSQCVGTF